MKDSDEAFEAYLERGDAVSRAQHASALGETQPELDARIIAGARRTSTPRRRGARWMVPAAMAAAVLLAVGLVVRDPAERVPADGPASLALPMPRGPAASAPAAVDPLPAAAPVTPYARTQTHRDPFSPSPLPEAAQARAEPASTATQPVGLVPPVEAPPVAPADEAADRLADIEGLLARGEVDAARVRFYTFRERFPAHPVPADLLTRLGM